MANEIRVSRIPAGIAIKDESEEPVDDVDAIPLIKAAAMSPITAKIKK